MNTAVIDGQTYIIMKRDEYVDTCNSFITDGRTIERGSIDREIMATMNIMRFYANEDNYLPDVSEVVGVEHGTGLMQHDLSRICADNGKRARDAISVLEHRDEDKR